MNSWILLYSERTVDEIPMRVKHSYNVNAWIQYKAKTYFKSQTSFSFDCFSSIPFHLRPWTESICVIHTNIYTYSNTFVRHTTLVEIVKKDGLTYFGIFLFVFLEYLWFFNQMKCRGKLPKGTMKWCHVLTCYLFEDRL